MELPEPFKKAELVINLADLYLSSSFCVELWLPFWQISLLNYSRLFCG